MKSEKARKPVLLNTDSTQAELKLKYTELRRLYKDLLQRNHSLSITNEQLLLQNREKTRFMDIASHDLQLPLSAISMMSETLLKRELPSGTPEETRIFGMIQDACLELKSLLANYTSANLSETGRMKLFLSVVDIGQLAAALVNRYAHFAAKKNLQLRFNTTENLQLHTDRECCAQIIENLLSNAIKYTEPGKTITVSVSSSKQHIVVAVADDGPGISKEEQALLFKRFQKLSARPTGGELSTGLGLSIVKYLAEQLAGSIGVESEPGKGSVFTLYLPNEQ